MSKALVLEWKELPDGRFEGRVVSQRGRGKEFFPLAPDHSNYFASENGWMLSSVLCPEIDSRFQHLFVRGIVDHRDHDPFLATKEQVTEINVAVAEYNEAMGEGGGKYIPLEEALANWDPKKDSLRVEAVYAMAGKIADNFAHLDEAIARLVINGGNLVASSPPLPWYTEHFGIPDLAPEHPEYEAGQDAIDEIARKIGDWLIRKLARQHPELRAGDCAKCGKAVDPVAVPVDCLPGRIPAFIRIVPETGSCRCYWQHRVEEDYPVHSLAREYKESRG